MVGKEIVSVLSAHRGELEADLLLARRVREQVRSQMAEADRQVLALEALLAIAGGSNIDEPEPGRLTLHEAMRSVLQGAPECMMRAQHLADTFGGKCIEWQARHAPTEILVNCTPIGMHPNVDESPFNKTHLKSNMIVFDTVYNPESTLLLKDAKSHGCRTCRRRAPRRPPPTHRLPCIACATAWRPPTHR